MWYEVRGGTSFFCIWMVSCPNSICWKNYPSSLNSSGTPVKIQLIINARVYFWIPNSIPVNSVHLYASTIHVDHWTLLVKFWNLEVWILQFCTSSLRLFWLLWVFYISIWIWRSTCQFLQNKKKKPARILMGTELNQ